MQSRYFSNVWFKNCIYWNPYDGKRFDFPRTNQLADSSMNSKWKRLISDQKRNDAGTQEKIRRSDPNLREYLDHGLACTGRASLTFKLKRLSQFA